MYTRASIRVRLGLGRFRTASEIDNPSHGCGDEPASDGPDPVGPVGGEVAGDDGGSEGAGGVEGSAGEGAAGEDGGGEGETDGQAMKARGTFAADGGSEDGGDKEECEDVARTRRRAR